MCVCVCVRFRYWCVRLVSLGADVRVCAAGIGVSGSSHWELMCVCVCVRARATAIGVSGSSHWDVMCVCVLQVSVCPARLTGS